MILTKRNAELVARKISKTLPGPVLFVNETIGEQQFDENGLSLRGWSGDAAKQPLPVKVLSMQIMFSVGGYSYTVSFDRKSEINFYENEVIIVHESGSGNKLVWRLANKGGAK